MIIRNYCINNQDVHEYICTRKMIVKLGAEGDCIQIVTDCKDEKIFNKFIIELAERIKEKGHQSI